QAQPWERGWTDAAAAVEANGRAWARMDADAASVPAASAAAEAAARLTVRPQDAQTRGAANADVMQRVASNGMEPEAGGASDGGAPHSVQSGAAAVRRGGCRGGLKMGIILPGAPTGDRAGWGDTG
ncbi:MAG: hypothetical protein LUF77_00400, partial [Oscillospiraceae bacterium]|nr:hypothetical protein [Oscillospiraceae bacterium]